MDNIDNKQFLHLDLESFAFDNNKYKTPFLYETWTWEGDESVLPYKWVNLIKNTNLFSLKNETEFNQMKNYLKEKYYATNHFDKNSFFFITYRSEVAACAYLNAQNDYSIDFFLVNNKHSDKYVEDGLFALVYNRANSLKVKKIKINLELTNISSDYFKSIGFI